MTGDPSPVEAMDCNVLVELVTEYLEGTLDERSRASVDAHLALCDGCDEYLVQMRTTIRTLGRLPPESVSDRAMTELLTVFRDVHRQHPEPP
ncbi:MAG: anti-sigma factor family protein [Actinomycetota bacterium]